ncbi:MaoC family dehydratase [Nocardioides carbamazepini]|nr:MaoC family dehydratase [Nocardioides carbamazepini]
MVTRCSGLADLVGVPLGHSGWIEVDQARIDQFAHATLDDQWIHVDVEQAANGPFGTTIAHGYLTLSLVSRFIFEAFAVDDVQSAVNYGLDRVRFIAPVPSGSRIRGEVTVAQVDARGGGYQVKSHVVVECDRSEGPVAVADVLTRFVPR